MTAILELLTYGVVFSLTLVFTMISLREPKEVNFKGLASICWFIFALVHFIVGDKDTALTYTLSILWLGIGLIFAVWGISTYFKLKHDRIFGFEE